MNLDHPLGGILGMLLRVADRDADKSFEEKHGRISLLKRPDDRAIVLQR